MNHLGRTLFLIRKKTQYAILSEFAYASDTFQFTTKSISNAIGISDKTLRTTMKELERSSLIYSFKFSTGQNTSKVYYVVNISTKTISKHMALALLYFYKPEVSPYTVQRTQNKLFRIESIRFKESIKPKLIFSVHSNQPQTDTKEKRILSLELNNETNATAFNISRVLEVNTNTVQLSGIEGFDRKRDHLTNGDKPILLHFGINASSVQ